MNAIPHRLINRSLRVFSRVGLFALLASCVAVASEKPWTLPSDSDRAAGWSLGDLDGDRVADLADAGPGLREGDRYVYKVQIDLSHSGMASFDVHGATASIRLCLRDIDGDHDRDLVVFDPSSAVPVGIWLNDGAGHFTEGRLANYAGAFGKRGPHSLHAARIVSDTMAAFSGDQLSFHILPVALTPATASRAPALFAFAVPRSVIREAFAPRGPPSLL